MYQRYFKRLIDFVLSLAALIVLNSVMLILTVLGAVEWQEFRKMGRSI